MGDGDDDILALDQVFVLDLALDIDDLGAAWNCELFLDARKLILDDVDDARPRGQDFQIIGDLDADLFQLIADLVATKSGQAL